MAKLDPFASVSDQPVPRQRAKFSFGRVLTGVLIVGSITFALAYYVPLKNAHSSLAQAHDSLTSSNAGTSVQLEKTTQQLLDAQKERQALADELKAIEEAKSRSEQSLASAADRAKERLDKLGKAVVVESTPRGLLVLLEDAKLFRAHQTSVHPPGRKLLCAVGAALKELEGKIEVGGHTQAAEVKNAALKADYPTAWELSAARAAGALRVLESCGVSGQRLRAVAHANQSPNKQAEKNSEGQISVLLVPDAEL